MKLMRKPISLLMAILCIFSVMFVGASANTARAEEAETAETNVSSTYTEYVLILDRSFINDAGDGNNDRIAAAKLFVDLLPADNARLSIFVIANKQSKGGFMGNDCYELLANKDHISDNYTHDRMQTIYQVVVSEDDLSMQNRTSIKNTIDKIFTTKSESGYSDTHCATYAAMDYLQYNGIKNACIVLISNQHSASAKNFNTETGSGDFYDAISGKGGDVPSFYEYVTNANKKMSDDDVKYNWSFNWLNTTPTNKAADESTEFYTNLCELFGGSSWSVQSDSDYDKIPSALVDILNKYQSKAQSAEVPVVDKSCTLTLNTAYSEINIAVTGAKLNGVTAEYQESEGAAKTSKEMTAKDTYVINDDNTLWYTYEVDPENKNKFTYATIKMILPNPGVWTLHFDCANDSDIMVQQILAQDADLVLNTAQAEKDSDGVYVHTFDNKQDVAFDVSFQYNGKQVKNTQYLNDNLPFTTLYYQNVDGTQVYTAQAQIIDGSLHYVIHPETAGTYRVWATIQANEHFSTTRSSDKTYRLTFSNSAPYLKDTSNTEQTITARPDETIDLAQDITLYTDDDGDTLTMMDIELVSSDSETGEKPKILEDGKVHVPNCAGKYVFTTKAKDSDGVEATDAITITVTVDNSAPYVVFKKDSTKGELYVGLNKLLLQLGLFDPEDKDLTYQYSDIFTDPDGDELTYTVKVTGNTDQTGESNLLKLTENADSILLEPVKAGSNTVVITITAADQTGASCTYTINVTVKSTASELFSRYWWILIVLAVIILIVILLMLGRRVHGHWSVEVVNEKNAQSCYHSFTSLASSGSKSLRKTKVSVKAIVAFMIHKYEMDEMIDISMMSGTNPVLYGTVAGGSCKMDVHPSHTMQVSINGNDITKAGKIKVKSRQEIRIVYLDEFDAPELTVTLSFN